MAAEQRVRHLERQLDQQALQHNSALSGLQQQVALLQQQLQRTSEEGAEAVKRLELSLIAEQGSKETEAELHRHAQERLTQATQQAAELQRQVTQGARFIQVLIQK